MSTITLPRKQLISLIENNIKAWYTIAGGPNLDAFEFSAHKADQVKLRELGYYDNKDAWVAGVQVRELENFLAELMTSQ